MIRKIVITLLLSLSMPYLFAQELKYQIPCKEILELADIERAPNIRINDKKTYAIYNYRKTYKSLDDLNQPELRLGGLRINPITHIASDATFINNMKLRKLDITKLNGAEVLQEIKGLPKEGKFIYGNFNKAETKYAFCHTEASGVALYVLDLNSATCEMLTSANLNACAGSPYTWISNDELLVKKIPSNAKELIDPKKQLPLGPTVSVSEGKASQNRTYADLLKNPQDEENFETIIKSELQVVNINKTKRDFLSADMYVGMSESPDEKYILVTTIKRPFSYIVPYSRFPLTTKVYTNNAQLVSTVNEVPLTEIMPKGFSSVSQGKRNLSWRADMPSTLFYVEALDEGDQSKKADYRDALYSLEAPFNGKASLLCKTKQRFSGIDFIDATRAFVSDSWYDTRNTKLYLINPSNANIEPKIVWDRNYQDIYTDPGNFETIKNQYGKYVIAIENNKAYLIGDGFTEKGQFPFISEMDMNTFKMNKIYSSTYVDQKEDIIEMLDYKNKTALIMLQSPSAFPNYYVRNIKKNKVEPVTQFKSPFAALEGVSKEVIKYKRDDGLPLSGTLYLPKGYNRKDKLPLLIWAYPEEFKDRNSAGQNSKNPNEFTYPNYGSFVYWVNKGYAVLDDASFPIIGEDSTEPNDNFMPQLIANAKAAIDAIDGLGYIDRNRCAVGGHSYGAFMTANLLTHSKLFACGIARSGAYNRTLTPFGFQSEQRNYWDVKNVYNDMSPFMNAEKMKTPMLLVHGDADNNPGTFTLQSERYFQALKGLGAPVRLLLLPKESHSYTAKENIFHLLWEQDQFLEKYLKK